MKPETIEFLPAPTGEPSASCLMYGLAGVTRALEVLTCQGEDDRDLIGNLASAADCLTQLVMHRMGNCPVTVQDTADTAQG